MARTKDNLTAPEHKRKRRKKKEVPVFLQLLLPFAPYPALSTNPDLAADLAEDYGYVQKGQCWKNAVLSMNCLGYRKAPDCKMEYVEGWLIIREGEYAIEHGWLEVEGDVVDVSLPGEHPASAYYAVYRYGFDDVQKLIEKRSITLPFFGNHEAGHAAMYEAWEQLPVNHDMNVALATLGYLHTGNWSVVIPEGVFLGPK